MERLKRIVRRLVFMPGWRVWLISLPAFALVMHVLASEPENALLAYVSYVASAYALIICCCNAPRMLRAARSGFSDSALVQRAVGSRRGQRFLNDPMYRAETALYAGLAVNLAYAVIKLVSGIVFHSLWFGALAGYYLLLSMLRFALLHHARRSPVGEDLISEWRRYRLCGCMLLIMNHALTAIVILVVRQNSGFVYPGVLIYIMAIYAFYAMINAVRSLIRFRHCGSPVLSAAKAVSLVAALVSVLSLETAMLTQFGKAGEERFRQVMTGATGAVVCLAVLAMAAYMIAYSTKQIRRVEDSP
ncbi:MAG: hypothetical protein ACI4L8_12120 [Candidatus Fimadaptatus sp.]